MGFPISTPIVKPVDGLCNLSCTYCYTAGLKSSADKKYMSEQTLASVIDFFCYDKKYTEFIWHGGEPLLASIGFYHKVVEYQRTWRNRGVKIVNFVQTNATLVTEKWAQFFSDNEFLVGVSIDGHEETHNCNRHYSSNTGSFADTMRGVKLLREAGVFNGAICGISKSNVSSPREVLDFFISQGIKKLKFARIKDIGLCKDVSDISISFAQYIDFLISVFDLWIEYDDPKIEVRDIQSVVNILMGGTLRECIYMGQCDQFVTVYRDGTIYACDSLPKDESLYFGNVFNDPTKVRNNDRLKASQEIARVRHALCQSCNWYSVCKSGCAKDHYMKLDSSSPIPEHCRELKRYFKHISTKLGHYGLV